MTRKLDLMIAVVVVAGGLAVSGRLPRLAAGRAGGGGGVAVRALEPLFGAAPAPAFRTMRRVEILELTDTQTGEHVYTVREANGWRSVVHETARHLMPVPGGATAPALTIETEMGGPLDLFRLTRGTEIRSAATAASESRVAEVSGVEGRLFPLAVGNHLRFEALEGGSVQAGRLDRETADRYVYEFTVTGVEDGWNQSTPAVPGPVYVIDLQIKDPKYGEDQQFEVHYAPALGAAVRVRTLGDAPPTDERLVSWEPAR
ncbi:MAG TPA: hypothetical protein VFJ82_08820 [Longimicrobium sp.]|nr:hypothetical protein [Longimicrobium sp.]